MELAIVGLFVATMVLSVLCWRFYDTACHLRERAEKDGECRAKLLREIEHLKTARQEELGNKLRAIGDILEPKPAVFGPYDTQDFHMSDILARHDENQ